MLAVRLDTVHWGSRWYPGAGLYRNVWLVKTPPLHVAHWGVYVTTPSITDEKGKVRVTATLQNQRDQAAEVSVRTTIHPLRPDGSPGEEVATTAAIQTKVPPGGLNTVVLDASVTRPALWALATPNRYLARTTISEGEQIVDRYDQPFGFRTIEFTPRDGFKLNGKRVFLKGTCNHHDLGALARRSTSVRWSGNSRSFRRWATTRCGRHTTRPRPSCSSWPTGWASW